MDEYLIRYANEHPYINDGDDNDDRALDTYLPITGQIHNAAISLMGSVEVDDDTRDGDEDNSILGDPDLSLRDARSLVRSLRAKVRQHKAEANALQRKNKALEKENQAGEENILQKQRYIQLRSQIQKLEVQLAELKEALRRERQCKVDALERLHKARLAASAKQVGLPNKKKGGRPLKRTKSTCSLLPVLYGRGSLTKTGFTVFKVLQNTGVFTQTQLAHMLNLSSASASRCWKKEEPAVREIQPRLMSGWKHYEPAVRIVARVMARRRSCRSLSLISWELAQAGIPSCRNHTRKFLLSIEYRYGSKKKKKKKK
eukprot:PhF_6_TR23281/c0_g2_i1/m.32788